MRRYNSPIENLPILIYFFNIYNSKTRKLPKKVSCVRDLKPLRWPITCDVAYDVGFPTVYNENPGVKGYTLFSL